MEEELENVQDTEEVVQDSGEESGEDISVSVRSSGGGEVYARPEDFPEDLEVVNEEESSDEESDEPSEEHQEEESEEGDDDSPQEEGEQEELGTEEEEIPSEEDDSAFFSELSEETGLDIGDTDVLIETLKHAKEVLENNGETDGLADLPSELKMAVEIAKTGGDYKQALSALSMDFDNMNEKEVLRQKFYQDNSSLVQKDKEYADMKFEREYESKYGILSKEFDDEFEKEEFESNNSKEIEFAKKSLQRDFEDSKDLLNEWKNSNITPSTPEESLSETEIKEITEKHNAAVQSTLDSFEGTHISIDDNPDNDYLVGVTEETRETLKEVLSDPRDFLSEVVGVNFDSGEIDYESLALAANLLLNADTLGPSLRQYSVERKNKETIEGMMDNPKTRQSQDNIKQPHEEGLVSAAKQIRKALRRG